MCLPSLLLPRLLRRLLRQLQLLPPSSGLGRRLRIRHQDPSIRTRPLPHGSSPRQPLPHSSPRQPRPQPLHRPHSSNPRQWGMMPRLRYPSARRRKPLL